VTDFPAGICIKTESGYYYVNSKSRLFISTKRILDSWRFPYIVETTEDECAKLPKFGKLGFRDGTLICDTSDQHLYLISKSLRRWVTGPDTLDRLGIKITSAVWVTHDEVELHKEGENIN
jgi:hypothetical protein